MAKCHLQTPETNGTNGRIEHFCEITLQGYFGWLVWVGVGSRAPSGQNIESQNTERKISKAKHNSQNIEAAEYRRHREGNG